MFDQMQDKISKDLPRLNIFIFGLTRSGKTTGAHNYICSFVSKDNEIYNKKNNDVYWCSYNQEKKVVIDDLPESTTQLFFE